MADLAQVKDIVDAWRPLKPVESTRVEYWIGAASRKIRRRWKDVDQRIAAGTLQLEDVTDVVVSMVLSVLPKIENNGVKSVAVAAGAESRAITLDSSGGDERLSFEEWMVEIFEGVAASTPLPQIKAPMAYGLNRIFPDWKEVYE
ncbi:Gp19/Gp15/Gp42-like protein [Arthrobacter sp. AG1021]|uniref:Gp19/Gp15/Gp42 family protein n=1 Tax=Arthrobacter sp. AG1021 TaxID=2183908 RepID=UPI000F1B22DB|nr:Gp19/Gp15/Gp42 family protein [Arthrobacter sp. AG1021]RKS16744.1 Gp19/Gp15/Gp42-like protein [Arthrobacter sp. AG1021]